MKSKNHDLITEILRKHLVPSEDFIFGFACLEGLLEPEFSQFPYGISIGRRLKDSIAGSIGDGPTMEYYQHYRQLNRELSSLTDSICEELRTKGIGCINVSPTVALDSEEFKPYLETLRYKFSHKMVATRAGLGWIGKTDLFISESFGPRLRLASILTNHPLPLSMPPFVKSRCGDCNVCVLKCPAGASNGKSWDIHTDRDLFFDAHKCREQCGKFGMELFNKDIRICGICVSVCPLGQVLEN
jgi:epoxyqueuosine reductase